MQVTLPKQPRIKEKGTNRAVFEISDLYPGYGVTVGNALRRALYSSLPGAAITKVKIKGAPHEFSTLPGVLEDVLEIILNLKQVYFKLHGDESQVATIKVKGSRKVTGSDIDTPSQLEVINKNVHIATITAKEARFEIELTVDLGLGYMPIELQKKERVEIGTIALDATYTPVRKVNFEVENMRVGDRTDYDRLIIEIVTNGTVSPEDALEYASHILVQHFELSGSFDKPAQAGKPARSGGKTKTTKAKEKKKAVKPKTKKSPVKAEKTATKPKTKPKKK